MHSEDRHWAPTIMSVRFPLLRRFFKDQRVETLKHVSLLCRGSRGSGSKQHIVDGILDSICLVRRDADFNDLLQGFSKKELNTFLTAQPRPPTFIQGTCGKTKNDVIHIFSTLDKLGEDSCTAHDSTIEVTAIVPCDPHLKRRLPKYWGKLARATARAMKSNRIKKAIAQICADPTLTVLQIRELVSSASGVDLSPHNRHACAFFDHQLQKFWQRHQRTPVKRRKLTILKDPDHKPGNPLIEHRELQRMMYEDSLSRAANQ